MQDILLQQQDTASGLQKRGAKKAVCRYQMYNKSETKVVIFNESTKLKQKKHQKSTVDKCPFTSISISSSSKSFTSLKIILSISSSKIIDAIC